MAQQKYSNRPPLQVPANVYELMVSHQLGRPLAFDREKPSAFRGGCLLVLGVFLELSLLPFIFLLWLLLVYSGAPISVATLLTPEGVGVALFFLLEVLFGILVGWGGFSLLTGPFQHLYLCEKGLVSLKGRREIVMRWDQITSVSSTTARFFLRRSDGVELIIGERPLEQEGALCRSIEQRVINQRLPQMLASYHAGIPIIFGDLTVTQQGLSLDHGRKTLPWSEVSEIKMNRGGVLSIGKRGNFWDWYSIVNMSNVVLFLELVHDLGVE